MTDKETKPVKAGVIEKLKAHKAANDGTVDIPLPETGVTFTYPKFRNHGKVAAATRIAKGDNNKAQNIYVVNNCLFDGEKLTVSDFCEYIPIADFTLIMQTVFGENVDGGSEGNAAPALH